MQTEPNAAQGGYGGRKRTTYEAEWATPGAAKAPPWQASARARVLESGEGRGVPGVQPQRRFQSLPVQGVG